MRPRRPVPAGALAALRLRGRAHRGLSPPPIAGGSRLSPTRWASGSARAGGRIAAVGIYVPGRHGGLSVLGADECDPGQGRGRRAHRHGGAGAGRHAQSAGARGGAASPASPRSTASAARRRWRARLWHGDDRRRGQDRRSRQRLCRGRQAPRLRHRRHRHDRRAFGDPGGRRRRERSRLDRRRSAVAGRARRGGAVDPHHRRCGFRRSGRRRGRTPARRRCRAAPGRRRELAAARRDHHGRATSPTPCRSSTGSRPSISNLALEDAAAEAFAGKVRQCRRDLPRPLHAGGGGRLRRRPQPRAADGAQRALLLGPRRARFHEAHLAPALRRRESARRSARPLSTLARAEGLDAHALSIAIRLNLPRR